MLMCVLLNEDLQIAELFTAPSSCFYDSAYIGDSIKKLFIMNICVIRVVLLLNLLWST